MSQNGPNGRSNVHHFTPRPTRPPPGREPAFNAPWPPLALGAALIALYALQSFAGSDRVAALFGLIPPQAMIRPWTLVTHLFVHGFWGHAIINAVVVLAFGTPLARRWGATPAGALRLLGFFLICGVLSGLGYALIHPDERSLLTGASGAAAGLMAAASRLMADPRRLSPLSDRQVIAFAVGWLAINLVFAVMGVIPGLGGAIAWEAHLIGYVAGLFLISPYGRLVRARVD